jgi:hypothetical protein
VTTTAAGRRNAFLRDAFVVCRTRPRSAAGVSVLDDAALTETAAVARSAQGSEPLRSLGYPPAATSKFGGAIKRSHTAVSCVPVLSLHIAKNLRSPQKSMANWRSEVLTKPLIPSCSSTT